MTRARLRDLGITIGQHPPGRHNAITDVPGVLVGHSTLIVDAPRVARTGVTVIVPRDGAIWENNAFAAYYAFNGNGEMTGAHWIEESGLLTTPIALTNTLQVGLVRDMLIAYEFERVGRRSALPVVAETWDGWLNDIDAFHLTQAHVYEAMEHASGGPTPEGNVGGGTATICHDFKGGIGTASRLVNVDGAQYTVGALVQTNHGDRHMLRVNGVPVGQEIGFDHTPTPWDEGPPLRVGSIIVVMGTDAPLLPNQCKRLAQRATVGLARVGGVGHNFSGDIFIAFAIGNDLPTGARGPVAVQMLRHQQLDPFFEAVAEAVEESILNSLTAAETMTGFKGRTAHALPLDALQQVLRDYQPRKAHIGR